MKRVKSIDGIVLDFPLYVSTEFDIDNYIGKRTIAIDGSSVMFLQAKGAMTNEVQMYSKDNAWVSKDVKDALINTMDELSKVVVYTDDSSDTFFFDHTKVPLQFTPLYNGCLWYNVTINLLKG